MQVNGKVDNKNAFVLITDLNEFFHADNQTLIFVSIESDIPGEFDQTTIEKNEFVVESIYD